MGKPTPIRPENQKTRPEGDFYPTHPYITKVLLKLERFGRVIWEPACGQGHMVEVLRAAGYEVIASDLYDRGYGITGMDFLKSELSPKQKIDAVVSNPPFDIAEAFVKRAITMAPKVALFLRLAFVESETRYNRIWFPIGLSRLWIFTKRVTLYPEGKEAERDPSGFMAYAWYIWDKSHEGPANVFWIPPDLIDRMKSDDSG